MTKIQHEIKNKKHKSMYVEHKSHLCTTHTQANTAIAVERKKEEEEWNSP